MELFILQVSCDSAAPELEDRTRFKRYFQMIPTEASLSNIFKALIDQYGWHKLHTIAPNRDVFITVCFSNVLMMIIYVPI